MNGHGTLVKKFRPVAKFLRTDIGGGYCFHVDFENGRMGLSQRDGDHAPSRPPHPDTWLEDGKILALYKALKGIVDAKGLIPGQEPTPKPPPLSKSTSAFLQANIKAIIKHSQGFMKTPPWWLRWLYSAVVTKEQYRG